MISSTGHFIKSSCGISIIPTVGLVEPDEFDMIVVVGGLLSEEIACDHATLKYIQLAARKRIPLIGVCTGSFVLAEAGLLGRHET
ncbi:DJ-1/PfpI family protein, partial [Agrobacterium pusense]|uniref:DJ-1/PfpI family protein n=2 Tax=Rhizobium/Agrobacterium group TaxID=227290 RepID=UPI003C6F817F